MGERADGIREAVETEWAPFRTAVADRLDEPTAAGWTAKEMLAHVAFWDEAVVPVVVTMFRGEELPAGWSFGSGDLGLAGGAWPAPDVHNAREAAWARARTPAEVLARADGAHAGLVALIGSLSDDEVAARPDYFEDLGSHYREHLEELA
jgi:hypothetical protein